MTVTYDPDRDGEKNPKWKKFMESREVQEAHEKLFSSIRKWKRQYRVEWENKEKKGGCCGR